MSRILGAAEDAGEEAAIVVLDELQNSGALDRLDLRERLEEDLLYWLARRESVQWKVLAKTRDLFDWLHGAQHVKELLGPAEAKRVLWRLEDLDAFERLEQRAGQGDEAAQILIGPYEPRRFLRIGLQEKLFLPIAEEVIRLRSLHPWVLDQILDSRVAQWWKSRCDRPRVYLRDVVISLLLSWVVAPETERPIFSTVGVFALVIATSFGYQTWKARRRVEQTNYHLYFLFWPFWLLVLPLDAPFVVLLLPGIYFFLFCLGFLRGSMGRSWYWFIAPAWLFAAVVLRAASPWSVVGVWAPGLVFLVGFATVLGHKVQLPAIIYWGWLLPAGLFVAVAASAEPTESLAFGLLIAAVWVIVIAAWGRRDALWHLPLLLAPFAAASAGLLPSGLPGSSRPLMEAELATRVDYSAFLLAAVAVYHLVRLATQAAASDSGR